MTSSPPTSDPHRRATAAPPAIAREFDDAPFPGKGWLMLLCLFVAVLTLWLLLYPFDFQSRRISSFLGERKWSQIHRINLALNLILFTPLGIVTGWAWRLLFPRRSLLLILLVTLDAAILSALGEYFQMWLPERTSSMIDLVANILGGAAGGVIGVGAWRPLTAGWCALARWLASRRHGRRAFVALVIVLLARTAPFDASLETYYLRTKFMYETRPAGAPFSATRQWLRPPPPRRVASAQERDRAIAELSRAGLNAALFFMLALTVNRAMQEHRAMGGRRGGVGEALVLCLLLVVATEALQLPVRSRLMDATDPVAGAAGVLLGVALARLRRIDQSS